MTISAERKNCVKDLYFNQSKTKRDIAKTERRSLRDISAILKQEEVKQQQIENDNHQE